MQESPATRTKPVEMVGSRRRDRSTVVLVTLRCAWCSSRHGDDDGAVGGGRASPMVRQFDGEALVAGELNLKFQWLEAA